MTIDNKEQIEFIQWLSYNPEEIVNILNELYKTEDGKQQVTNLVANFKESKNKTGMFANGGKIDYLVTKYQNGGEYNRRAGREQREK